MSADRETQLNSVIERIRVLADSPVSGDGEWPTLTVEQVRKFDELLSDIADLAFPPDYEGSNVLTIRVVDKKRWQMHEFYTSHERIDNDTSDREAFEILANTSQTARLMISTADRILNHVHAQASFRAHKAKGRDEQNSELDALEALLDANKLVEFREEADRLIDKYDPQVITGNGPVERGNYRKLPDRLTDLIGDYGQKLPEETYAPAIAHATTLLDMAEKYVGIGHKDVSEGDPCFDSLIYDAREALLGYQIAYGRNVMGKVNIRCNRMQEEHRVLKRLKGRGIEMVKKAEA